MKESEKLEKTLGVTSEELHTPRPKIRLKFPPSAEKKLAQNIPQTSKESIFHELEGAGTSLSLSASKFYTAAE